ncbi:hypothetical protein BV20DRAFT_978306 [Pilatotrama ljubarskyi]|nr:hypothetical protein BV20DRAFT_978306 [Pilatotrama ljubarskyi]
MSCRAQSYSAQPEAAFQVQSCNVQVTPEETKATIVVEPKVPGPLTIMLSLSNKKVPKREERSESQPSGLLESPTPIRTRAPPENASSYHRLLAAPWSYIGRKLRVNDSPKTVPDSQRSLSDLSALSVQEESETEEETERLTDLSHGDVNLRHPEPDSKLEPQSLTDSQFTPPREKRDPFSTPESVRQHARSPPTRKRKHSMGGVPPASDAMDPTMRFVPRRRADTKA